jgi:nucleotidyltransferase substrate binding protein (TIGR01987 family)
MFKKIELTAMERALKRLGDALTPPPANDRERDGAIQRFEYSIEISWKTGQKVLRDLGIVSNSPKSVVRDLGQQGLIDNVQDWIDFLNARNETAHTYKEEVAERVFKEIPPFYRAASILLNRFQHYVQDAD